MSRASRPPTERRGPDRRRRPTPMLSRYWLRGRRRSGRRSGDIEGIYVDRPRVSEVLLAAGLALLCGLDLGLTLVHLEAGGGEANPLMAAVHADAGTGGFVLAKLAMALPAAVFLLLHVRFRGVRRALQGLVALYGALLVWHGVVALDRLGGVA